MAGAAYIVAEEGLNHDTGEGHPECPARLRAVRDAFAKAGFESHRLPARKATHADLTRVHSEEHVAAIETTCTADGGYPDPDTVMGPGSWEAALLAAGAAIAACEAVAEGTHDRVFSACRPPGHHAERDFAMGFCLFNNVAVAARWLQAVKGLERIAILDWDVHHGNGTQHSFYQDATVYYASLHQSPHYPGTGKPEERGEGDTNLNVIFPPNAPAEDWLKALRHQVIPELKAFRPDFVLVSAGFDAHRADPLANQNLEASHFVEMTGMVQELTGNRFVSLLEGGYNLEALAECAVAHFQALQ